MNDQLSAILSENPQYKEAYYGFLEIHKKNRGGTAEELAEFEKYYARDFLNGIKRNSTDRGILIKDDRLTIRRACIEDADFMRSVELDEDNSPWVADCPLGWRIAKFGDEDFLQTIIEKGKGYGKEALLLAQKLAFEVFGTKCLYLGTKEANLRAQSIYKATGFIPDMPDPCTRFHINNTNGT